METPNPLPPPKLVFVNGPPRSGKDFFGKLVAGLLPASVGCGLAKFAEELKDITHAMFGMPNILHDHFEAAKDEPCAQFLGMTPREAYIWVSEECFKPKFGDAIFGEMLWRRLARLHEERLRRGTPSRVYIITDSGFAPEAQFLIEAVGPENCIGIQLEADGCDFSGDSRGYVDFDELGVRSLRLINPKTDEFFQVVEPVANHIKEWTS